MRQGWLYAKRWKIAIVSLVFGRSGLVVGYLRRIDLFRLGEELHCSSDCIDIFFYDFRHMLEFSDAALEFQLVGPDREKVFEQLDRF